MLSFSIAGGGGATAAVLTLDTAVDESRKEAAEGVTRSPNRFVRRRREPILPSPPSSTIFSFLSFLSFLAFRPCSSLYFLFSPAVLMPVSSSPLCCFVRAAVICTSRACFHSFKHPFCSLCVTCVTLASQLPWFLTVVLFLFSGSACVVFSYVGILLALPIDFLVFLLCFFLCLIL